MKILEILYRLPKPRDHQWLRSALGRSESFSKLKRVNSGSDSLTGVEAKLRDLLVGLMYHLKIFGDSYGNHLSLAHVLWTSTWEISDYEEPICI